MGHNAIIGRILSGLKCVFVLFYSGLRTKFRSEQKDLPINTLIFG